MYLKATNPSETPVEIVCVSNQTVPATVKSICGDTGIGWFAASEDSTGLMAALKELQFVPGKHSGMRMMGVLNGLFFTENEINDHILGADEEDLKDMEPWSEEIRSLKGHVFPIKIFGYIVFVKSVAGQLLLFNNHVELPGLERLIGAGVGRLLEDHLSLEKNVDKMLAEMQGVEVGETLPPPNDALSELLKDYNNEYGVMLIKNVESGKYVSMDDFVQVSLYAFLIW